MTHSPAPRDRATTDFPAGARNLASAVIPIVCSLFLAAPAAAQQEWRHHGGDLAETRYSPLDRIDAGNVDGLGIAWSWEIPKTDGGRTRTASYPLSSSRHTICPPTIVITAFPVSS